MEVKDESEDSDDEPEDEEDAKLTTKYQQVHDSQDPEDDEIVKDESDNGRLKMK